MASIVALATGRPPAAVAVVRLSGEAAGSALEALTGRALPTPRKLVMRRIHGPEGPIDHCLVAWFPGPGSSTGEDLAEFHLHGGPAVVSGLIEALLARDGIRLAEPGEFTRRAFANGRMDLAEVEGLADLVTAETPSQRTQALALAGGALSRLAEAWRQRCLGLLAEAEAGLDFAEDEADVAARLDQRCAETLAGMADELRVLLLDASRAVRVRDGLTIVVTGPPNVGKSSLVNSLAGREVSIVTAVPGTTRDVIETPIALDGVAAVLIDTAGLRETSDAVEAEGVRRARARAEAADLVLHVTDEPGTAPPAFGWQVLNKCDLHGAPAPGGHFSISTRTGVGLSELKAALADWAHSVVRPGEPAVLSHARHREAFAEAAAAIEAASQAMLPELRAECLRLAARAFGRIAGRIGVEDVLDEIFSRFCIGK